MTRLRFRHILLASLLLFYGALTVGGPALHSLPGAGHSQSDVPARGEDPDLPTSPHNDCPVCHFLAQGQITGFSILVPSLDVVRIEPVDDLALSFPPTIDRPSFPRAPPSA